jgi:hypothetical protein
MAGAWARAKRFWGALPWPLPALLTWALGWAAWALAREALSPGVAFGAGVLISGAAALLCQGRWRQWMAALGFPLLALALGATAGVSPLVWLGLLLILLVAYPLRAWRDAPFFPTPRHALDGLAQVVGSPARVLDAGCGLGHGLRALRRQWPAAHLSGLEWSAPLAFWAARRCPDVEVHRADMWAASWSGYGLVYLFQRPESMQRAWAKAQQELAPGAWLVSLEFAVPGVPPVACLHRESARPVWIYRVGQPAGVAPAREAAQPKPRRADKQLSTASAASRRVPSCGAPVVPQLFI